MQKRLNTLLSTIADGRKAMELRQEYAAQGKENNWTFLFYHDVITPFAKM